MQGNNSRIPTIMNAKFSGYFFIRTRTFGDVFKPALVYLYWDIKFPQQNINRSKLVLVMRICQWTCCQTFSENLLLGTLIICSVNALCICTNYSLFNWTWHSSCFKLCFIVIESNKSVSIFPLKKQIFYYTPDLRY